MKCKKTKLSTLLLDYGLTSLAQQATIDIGTGDNLSYLFFLKNKCK
jgi:hypothetical protein